VAHVSLVPMPKATGEAKTKPTQQSVRELRGLGLSPDLIVVRSEKPIGKESKDKISLFCHVAPEQVICVQDLSSIYHVPILMDSAGVTKFLAERLQLTFPEPRVERPLARWRDLARKFDNLNRDVTIVLVGKYVRLEDAYTSVSKALQHASIQAGYRLNLKFVDSSNLEREMKESNPILYHEAWQILCGCDGLIVPGGFGNRGINGKIRACNWAREKKKPFLGICLGLQVAVIEFARNVLGLTDAHSTECDEKTSNPLVIDMPEHHTGYLGGTMRLGRRTTIFKGDSVIRKLYGSVETIDERHRHRYEVNPKYVSDLEAKGLKFVGHDSEKERMEILELENHPYFVATQYHPEYLSRPLKPSPPFMGLILASVGKLQSYLNQGCRLSPRQMSGTDESSEDDDETIRNLTHSMNKSTLLTPPKVNHHKTNGFKGLNGHTRNGYSAESSSTEEAEK
jgi:CTP synthase